ncbi:Gmad2 immunoglobulin-like domain-containing protein [Candidatus Parcubacteria bacterium]|nr:Gmad2 immunoglobulin-like domain-containing protein [Candidatus Parcubacteria bacterium]
MKKSVVWVVALVVVVLLGWLIYSQRGDSVDAIDDGQTATSTPSSGNNGAVKGTPILPIVGTQASAGDIVITKPKLGDKITSPLTVTGRAKGGWYFEASAPVMVIDTNGKVLGRGTITAQGDWMQATGTVPFTGTIVFSGNTSNEGAVVFMNDNPSGLEANARYYAVPIFFK